MKILSFIKTSTLDYPQKIVAAVFLGGCNFDCEYCHNRELINPVGIDEVISVEELVKFLKKRKGILDGVCFSGGEASIHGDALIEVFRMIKEQVGNEFLIKLDTNGSNPEFLLKAKKYIDYAAIDYKTYNYEKNLNIDKNTVLESIEILKENYDDYEVRITMYPPYISLEDIPMIIEELQDVKKVYIQGYEPVEGASEEVYSREELYRVGKAFVEAGTECEVRC